MVQEIPPIYGINGTGNFLLLSVACPMLDTENSTLLSDTCDMHGAGNYPCLSMFVRMIDA